MESLIGNVLGEQEFVDASKPRPVFAEGDYPFVVVASGADVSEKADPATGLATSPKVTYAPLRLEFSAPDGMTTEVYHNLSIMSHSGDAKKAKQISGIAARFFTALGLDWAAAQGVTHPQQLVGLGGRARLIVGKTNTGRDRNEVDYFLSPNGAA